MADYPSAITNPRTVANKSGVVYEAAKTTIVFAEDINNANNEIKAIETELGTLPKGQFASVKERLAMADDRILELKIIDDATALTTGDGKLHIFISNLLNSYRLSAVAACVSTVSSSGTPTIQIHNVTNSADMLSTRITIDANEKTSYTAATPEVIDTDHDHVHQGDELRIDVDVAGTGAKGLVVILSFTPDFV